MKHIQISRGLTVTVDDSDFDRLSGFTWYAKKGRNENFYAIRYDRRPGGPAAVAMHRQILGVTDSLVEIDHIDGNGLNNQRINLRTCTTAQNQRNRGCQRNNTSGFKGVDWNKQKSKWRAKIWVDGKTITLGIFQSKVEAALSYNRGALMYHGEFACINELTAEEIASCSCGFEGLR